MSTASKRRPPEYVYLTNDLERPHGPKVNVCGKDGRQLGWLDRPLAELLVELLDEARRRRVA